MKRLDNNYIKIQENIDPRLIFIIIQIILSIVFIILVSYGSSKRNLHLESILKKITGKKYYVRIIKGEKTPNAFCFGGLGKSIFIYEGLMNLLNEREVIAVCLHEIGHITNLDIITNSIVDLSSGGFAGLLVHYSYYTSITSTSSKVKLMATFFVAILIALLIRSAPAILLGKIHEYKADRYASKFGYGKDLISALRKLEEWVKNYKFKIYGNPTKFEILMDKLKRFIDVHPSIENRIKELFESEKFYEEIYNKNISGLKKLCEKIFI